MFGCPVLQYSCMPQGDDVESRTELEKVEFDVMLSNVNLLYLGCAVIILLDLSYLSRFWTQFEAYLSLRNVSVHGLINAPIAERRLTIVCIHNAPLLFKEALLTMWGHKDVVQAHDTLSKPDVTVTNQRDKKEQLAKLLAFNDFARRVFCSSQTKLTTPMVRALSGNGYLSPMHTSSPHNSQDGATSCDVFISLVVGEITAEAEKLQRRLESNGKRVLLCRDQPGCDLHAAIASAMDACKLAVILASESYGRVADTLFDTSKQLAFIISEKKPYLLIKMCNRWTEPTTRMAFATAPHVLWMPGESLSDELVNEVIMRLDAPDGKMVNAEPPRGQKDAPPPGESSRSSRSRQGAVSFGPTSLNHPVPRKVFLHLAAQPTAVIAGQMANRVNFLSQLTELKNSLLVNSDATWSAMGPQPCTLSDCAAPHLAASIRNGEIHAFVWCADGHGWETVANPENTSLSDLEAAVLASFRVPAVAIVCLKYGAKSAASRLHSAGVPLVIGVRMVLEQIRINHLFLHCILPTIVAMHSQHLELAELQQSMNALMVPITGDSTEIICMGSAEVGEWTPLPLSSSNWVRLECARLVEKTNIVEGLTDARLLVDCALLACDTPLAAKTKELLGVGQGRSSPVAGSMLPVRIAIWTDEADSVARCRAIALDACLMHIQAAGKFELVYRVFNKTQLEQVEQHLQASPGLPVLIWFDVMKDSELPAEAIVTCLDAFSNTHALLTCDDACRDLLDIVMEAGEWDDVELPKESGHPGVQADVLHLVLQLIGRRGEAPCALLEVVPVQVLYEALQSALPGGDRPLAALYSEDDGSVLVRMHVSDVALLHLLRDEMLTGVFEAKLSDWLQTHCGVSDADEPITASVNRTQFAEAYEQGVLQLEKLTPHQREKRAECRGKNRTHIMAPAGAGKTYVAMYEMLDVLTEGESMVLFVTRAAALCCFVARWLCARVPATRRKRLLKKLHVMHEPFEAGPRACGIKNDQIAMIAGHTCRESYDTMVVDEAHHLYRDPVARDQVNQYMNEKTRLLILSDISQSGTSKVDYPPGLYEVKLTEVVRCSKRIVAAASAFQLGGEEKLMTQCHHESTGPPLKSFLFDLAPDATLDTRYSSYAERVLAGIEHITSTFPGLLLTDRLAILVPDQSFLDGFMPVLLTALTTEAAASSKRFGKIGRRFALQSAKEAASVVSRNRASMARCETLVLDKLSNFDGLERLMVMGVGLDAPLEIDTGDLLETRSRMYRAVTRSHMLAIVVNESIRGGMLEWLNTVKLTQDSAYDREGEVARQKTDAVDKLVMQKQADPSMLTSTVHGGPAEVAWSKDWAKDGLVLEPGDSSLGISTPGSTSMIASIRRKRLEQSIWDTRGNTCESNGGGMSFNPLAHKLGGETVEDISLDKLPADLLYCVMCGLGSLPDLCALMRAHRIFNEAAADEDLWDDISKRWRWRLRLREEETSRAFSGRCYKTEQSQRILFIGGHEVGPRVDSFEIRTRIMRQEPDLAYNISACAAATNGKTVYLVGGNKNDEPYNEVITYRGVQESLPVLAETNVYGAADMDSRGRLWLVGGGTSMYQGAQIYTYVKVLSLDETTPQWMEAGHLAQPRCGHALAYDVRNSMMYTIGGYGGGTLFHDTVETFDTQTGQSLVLGPRMHEKRSGAGAGFGPDGCLYVCGGSPNGSQMLSSAERYDPRRGAWETLPQLPADAGYTTALFGLDGVFYCCGGMVGRHFGNEQSNKLFAFDPRRGAWEQVAEMPTARSVFPAVLVDW